MSYILRRERQGFDTKVTVMQSALSGAWNLVVEAGKHRDRIQDAKDGDTKAADAGFKSSIGFTMRG